MQTIAFFDAKPYDVASFDHQNTNREHAYTLRYYDSKLTNRTALLADGCDAVCAFVNDDVDAQTIDTLYRQGVRVLALRCAGYSNVDVKAAYQRLHILRVPAYSPHAVAEHAMGLLLAVNRKLYKAYNRTRDFNFSIAGLTGTDLHGKTVGVIGTGKIGRAFINICKGFGMRIVAYDPYPAKDSGIDYLPLETLLRQSDVVSLHCPLTEQSHHLLDTKAFACMKDGVFILNTSRGALIDAHALLEALNSGKVRAAGLDVYEEEAEYFYEDRSETLVRDDVLSLLLTRPNVLLTSHQAFLTEEALNNIAETTLHNLDTYFADAPLENEVCYRCQKQGTDQCRKKTNGRCF